MLAGMIAAVRADPPKIAKTEKRSHAIVYRPDTNELIRGTPWWSMDHGRWLTPHGD
jgi:hypothetical protein